MGSELVVLATRKLFQLACTLVIISLAACTAGQPSAGDEGGDPEAGDATVTIHRDDWGVPHIYAPREAMGFYGLGYAQAEDQLESFLGGVMLARGMLAALQGESRIAMDIELRRWRHAQEGDAGLSRLEPRVRENYAHFLAGVRRYMSDHPDKVPAWAPDFDVTDLLAINRAIFWIGYAAVEGPAECQAAENLQASIGKAAAGMASGASNGWVISPQRSSSGATLLLADPHVDMQNPIYYEYRMHAGALDSAGFAMGPLLWQAHNGKVAWAMTTGNPDMWDCYEVEVDPENPTRYLFDGEWKGMLEVEEAFAVRDGETVTKVFEYTRHNGALSPVVARRGNKAYVVSASQMHDAGLLDNEIDRMNRAGNIRELQLAMKALGMFPQNIIAGDSSGNIWYFRAGKTPVRPGGYDWTRPVPGNDSSTAWQGHYALDEMIQLLNPPQGFIQNNNVAPDRMFAAGNLDASAYPQGLFHDTPGRTTARGLRSIEVLSGEGTISLHEAREHAFDETWITARYWVAALRYAVLQNPEWLDQHEGEAAALVRRILDFNGVAAANSAAALNFHYWRSGMAEVLARPGFEHLLELPWDDSAFSPEFGAAVLRQAELAADLMVEELGSTDVAMGAVFRVGRGEETWPLGGESIVVPGMPRCLLDLSPLCEQTMRAFASSPPDDQGQRRVRRGTQSMRLVELANPVQAWSVHAFGQSSDPASPHFDDQAILFSERRFKPTYFSRQELEDHIESTLVLEIDSVPGKK